MSERLQKLLARAGYGSRRAVEALIREGRVSVNGALATLGSRADAASDRIEVDGRPIELPSQHTYLLLHKPRGYVTTVRDPQGRPTVMRLLPPGTPQSVVPVGRLDFNTEGALLFTDDGELAHRLTHPRWQVEKEYLALVRGIPHQRALSRLRTGVIVDGEQTAPARVERLRAPASKRAPEGTAWLRLVLHEGRKRQVRLMCAAVGHPVLDLVRVRVGPVRLGRLPVGVTRPLTAREVAGLRRLVGLPTPTLPTA